jgi:hypothetical protein
MMNNAYAKSNGDGLLHSILCQCSLFMKYEFIDTVFINSGVQHFDMFKLRIFRIYSADIVVFIYI